MRGKVRITYRAALRLGTLLLLATVLSSPPLFGQLGSKMMDLSLRDTSGKEHSLSDYAGKIVLLEFWSFKCPVSLAYNERIAALQAKYSGRGLVVLAVASNKNESPAEIARNASNLNLPFPVLLDRDGRIASRLGATHTPSIFILDREGILRYRGAIDNNRRPGEAGRKAFAEQALDALSAGIPVPQSRTEEFGCRIKRNSS
jgi:peroxiredoxin